MVLGYGFFRARQGGGSYSWFYGDMDDGAGDDRYRTCPECQRDCEPVPFETDEGLRISFICPLHGVHTVIDPFEQTR